MPRFPLEIFSFVPLFTSQYLLTSFLVWYNNNNNNNTNNNNNNTNNNNMNNNNNNSFIADAVHADAVYAFVLNTITIKETLHGMTL